MTGSRRVLRNISVVGFGVVVLTLLVLWLMGVFHAKVPSGPPRTVLHKAPDAPVLEVVAREVIVTETAVGTVEAARRIRVGSRLLAKVLKVHVHASQHVTEGEVLVELDDRDLRAAVAEARAACDSARAARTQAETDLTRSRELLARGATEQARVDRDTTAFRRATADVERLTEALAQAETRLAFATIRSPSPGIVIDKLVEPGNLASPGQDLVTLYDPRHLQLVASVREALATRLKPGAKVGVRLDSLDLDCQATIARIVPEAERRTRSFQVEVTGPCPPGALSGMFGRLVLPVGRQRTILIPDAALRRTGQIDLAFVVRGDGTLLRRFVRVGKRDGDQVEILAGLQPGERILARAPEPSRR